MKPGSGGDPAHGLTSAIEMCNNNGHCRKFDAGTMCPSFRVTRDEQHTTRGRANTLRLALAGQLGQEDFAGDAVRDALDLCVSCKGCRRECPTGVDMAKLKIYSCARNRATAGPSSNGYLPTCQPRYAPALAAYGDRQPARPAPGAARLSERWLGLSQAALLPQWHASFLRTARRVVSSSASATLKPLREVVFSSIPSAITSRTQTRTTATACSKPPVIR